MNLKADGGRLRPLALAGTNLDPDLVTIEEDDTLLGDDYINPNAQDGEPEAPDVRTDPVEDDPDADHEAVEED